MTDCPTPDKHRYATREGAQSGARRSLIAVGTLYPYACPCTWWHLTKHRPEEPLNPTDADPLRVQYLQTVPDITFRTTVVEDATGKAPATDRLALRHPANLKRWHKILGQLIHDAEQQLADRADTTSLAAHDWRRRHLGYRTSLQTRRTECQQLRAEAHISATAQAEREAAHLDKARQTELCRAEREAARLNKASQKELRRLAGDAAIKRLMADHPDTWARYLTEECDRIGVDLPARYRDLPQTA
ncbi:hypothetical protein [Streptomyces sp. NPDC015130]|uniref:hypothetical protein n=1 Tax=Streptomyces sp. NPDC015130 TaxID=3364940 RepID=UPI0036F6BCB1